jgi:hypothetical protein
VGVKVPAVISAATINELEKTPATLEWTTPVLKVDTVRAVVVAAPTFNVLEVLIACAPNAGFIFVPAIAADE